MKRAAFDQRQLEILAQIETDKQERRSCRDRTLSAPSAFTHPIQLQPQQAGEEVHQAESPPVTIVSSGSSDSASDHQAESMQQSTALNVTTVSSGSSNNSPVPTSSRRKRGPNVFVPTRQLRSASMRKTSSTPVPERTTLDDTPSSKKISDSDSDSVSDSDSDSSVSVSDTLKGSSESLFQLGTSFQAANPERAKDWMLRNFARVHVGGHVACRNSNWRKVLIECKLCNAGASAGLLQRTTWVLRHMREGALAPCRFSSIAPKNKGNVTASSGTQKIKGNANPLLTCTSCGWEFEGFPKKFVSCELNDMHKYCPECFADVVKQCVNGAGRNAFIASGIINCGFCAAPPSKDFRNAFNMRVCSQYLDEQLYQRYMSGLSESQVIRVQKECEERVKKAAKDPKDVPKNQTPEDLENQQIGECQCF
jgi:hypothetical protein